jgi:hypothetical protein
MASSMTNGYTEFFLSESHMFQLLHILNVQLPVMKAKETEQSFMHIPCTIIKLDLCVCRLHLLNVVIILITEMY